MRTTLLLIAPVLTASAVCGTGPLLRSSHSVSALAASRISPALMLEKQDVDAKVAELRASWLKAGGENSGKTPPSQEQFEIWAEEQLTEEARAAKVLQSLEEKLAEDDRKALEHWNSPEMVAAREAKAAKKAAEAKNQ